MVVKMLKTPIQVHALEFNIANGPYYDNKLDINLIISLPTIIKDNKRNKDAGYYLHDFFLI